jgi:hypothetical protein
MCGINRTGSEKRSLLWPVKMYPRRAVRDCHAGSIPLCRELPEFSVVGFSTWLFRVDLRASLTKWRSYIS